jgi:TPP-dependent indolepyruvate ferredoxin oxidoreductase alpha subunit
VRLTLDQVRTTPAAACKTGMFVSGYRGSPVGMLDAALLKQQKLLLEHNINFVDGINEDLAATAVWGTQMLHAVGGKKFDGVTGMWYGKAPGVDRSGDALKHAQLHRASTRTAASSRWSAMIRAANRRRCAANPSRCCSTSACRRSTRATCRRSSTWDCTAT